MSSFLSLSSAVVLFALSAAPAAPAAPAAAATSTSTAKSVLPWIADDYTAAAAEAKRRGVPLFVEAWAPW
jgi:hypothetical protein